jgi:fatty acid desaturase
MTAAHGSLRPDWVSLSVVSSHLALVLSPIYAAAVLPLGWLTIAAWLLFGLSMNGILNLMHECAHIHVFTKRHWSEALGRFVIGRLVFANFDEHRRRHWNHHRHLGHEGETKDTYLIDIRRVLLIRYLLRCLSIGEAFKKFYNQARSGSEAVTRSRAWLLRVSGFQLVFLSSLVFAACLGNRTTSWAGIGVNVCVAYGFVYLYGLMSITVFMAALRAIAEHQLYDDGATENGYAALRNFRCSPLSRYLMGAYGFGEHHTHHRYPAIPYYQLAGATRELARSEPALTPGKDYFAVLFDLITAPSSASHAGVRRTH